MPCFCLQEAIKGKDSRAVECLKTIALWTRPAFLELQGKDLKEIKRAFEAEGETDEIKPIALVDPSFLGLLGQAEDSSVYCGKAYFAEHYANRHPELETKDYAEIQRVLRSPDAIYFDGAHGTHIFAASAEPPFKYIAAVKTDTGKRIR